MKRFVDQHVVVTGAGSGIGRAVAVRLATEGATVSLLGRTRATLEETAGLVRAIGGLAHVEVCDLSVASSVDEAFDALPPVNILVANAGIGGPNTAGPDDRFEAILETNVVGTYRCLRAAQRRLVPGPAPRNIVVTASILGRFGVPGYTGYCASKTALIGLVRALALELAGDNVQVNAICPGWVSTDMAWQGIDGMAAGMGLSREDALAVAMRAVPLGRMSAPEDIAGMVAWLCSPDARGVTGQAIDQNGGAWMG